MRTFVCGSTLQSTVQGSLLRLHLSSQAGYLHHLADTALTLLTQLPCMSESSSVICTPVTPTTHRNMLSIELSTGLRENLTMPGKAPSRAFSLLKAPTSAFNLKNLLRQNAKHVFKHRAFNKKRALGGPSPSIVKFRLPIDVVVMSCWPWTPCH